MAKSFLNQPGLPLGLRNNNPGNIRPGDSWQGMIGVNQGFVVFDNIIWGIRAMATDLVGDLKKGLNTLDKLIMEYAPPTENDTKAYIEAVSRYTGLFPNQIIDPTRANLIKLLRGFMNVELGKQYAGLISDEDLINGLELMRKDLVDYIKEIVKPVVTGRIQPILLIAAIGAGLFYFRKYL